MDKNHQLDAPDQHVLETVEQLADHSELSALYPQQTKQWDGELMTTEQRTAAQDKAVEEISTSLRRHFATIGILVPLPLLLAGAIVASALEVRIFSSIEPEAKAVLAIATIIIGGAWFVTSFIALRKVVHLFYDHALRAAPFIVVLLALISISLQSFYILTFAYHEASPLITVGVVGAATVAWSVLLSFALLWIWTAPRLSDLLKITYIGVITLGIVAAAAIIGIASVLVQ